MAVLSLLFSFVGKKLGDLLQAIFGWAVTALFGQLPRPKQLAVSGALLASAAWPVFVAGIFFPGVASWALAFLPAQHWVGHGVLRTVWGALAFAAPPVAGALTCWAAPAPRGGVLRSLVNSYPLALGYFLALSITVITVPIVKLLSLVRGWDDEHVYLQPKAGHYHSALHELAEACARAGAVPEISEMPLSMRLATGILRKLAGGVVKPIMGTELQRVTATGFELYLYPADLLMRGQAKRIASVRAMFLRASLEKDAYLVSSPSAQELQDDLGRLTEIVESHRENGYRVRSTLLDRLAEAWHRMNGAGIPYAEYAILDTVARKVERLIVSDLNPGISFRLDTEADALPEVAARANDPEELMGFALSD